MVKALMSDDHLVQAPILVFPQAFLPATQQFLNSKVNSTNLVLHPSLDEGRCEELLELAKNMDVDFPHLSRASSYLRSLTDSDRRHTPYPKLKFIESGPAALNRGLNDIMLGQRLPEPKPHKLKVVFHHLPRR